MKKLPKLQPGDKVAVVSPSFAAPGRWPDVYELGLKRIREVFGLEPVELPTTRKIGASGEERAADLASAFADREIKAVIASLGGDDQVTYIKNIPADIFVQNAKPFLGFSGNSHFCNFLFLNGIPSYYGASLFTQFAMPGEMDAYTIGYIRHALFDMGEFELEAAPTFSDTNISVEDGSLLNWDNPESLRLHRMHEVNEGWSWDGENNGSGLLWGGCLESVDDMLRHGVPIPSADQFDQIVLMLETSEEIPASAYVHRVVRALGARGILERVQGVLVGRPKAWEFNKQNSQAEKVAYAKEQREVILKAVRKFNQNIPVIQNLDFGHTDPQIPMPYGGMVRIDSATRKIFASF